MPTPEELAAQKAADEATKKAAEDAAKKAEEDARKAEEAKLADIAKNPEAINALLEAKRAANEEAKKLRLKLEELDKAEKAKEAQALQEQGKFKELAEKEKQGRETDKTAFTGHLVALSLKIEAQAAGSVDADAVAALADRSQIKVGDDFTVTGAKEAVEALKKGKPYLFGEVQDPKIAPPKTGVPSPRGGFGVQADVDKTTARDLITRGLEGKK